MWIYLIRDLMGQFFFFFWITGPHGSLRHLWLARGQCCTAQVIVPCCQRLPGPAGSQTVWVSNILPSTSRRFLDRQRIFKHILKIFVNLKGFKYLSRLERLTTKPSQRDKKKGNRKNVSNICWDECFPHEFQHMFRCEVLITVRLWNVYATAQVNTQNYLAMSLSSSLLGLKY